MPNVFTYCLPGASMRSRHGGRARTVDFTNTVLSPQQSKKKTRQCLDSGILR